jgi:dGTPase
MVPVRQSQEVVAALFEHYLHHRDMPGQWGRAAQEAEDDGEAARIVCDFIAGMTDPYALERHGSLFGGVDRAV